MGSDSWTSTVNPSDAEWYRAKSEACSLGLDRWPVYDTIAKRISMDTNAALGAAFRNCTFISNVQEGGNISYQFWCTYDIDTLAWVYYHNGAAWLARL